MNHEDLNPREAEDVVIGQVLFEPGCISRAATILKPDHFYGAAHRTTFSAAMDLWRDGTAVDLITMTHKLRKDRKLDLVGGAYQLVQWTRHVAQTTHLEEHALIVREQFSLRILREAGQKMSALDVTADTDAIIGAVTAELGKAVSSDIQNDVNAAERAYALSNEVRPKPWYFGMEGLDQTVFILPGNVITISAPAGVGKTAFCLCAAINLSPVLKPWFVSLEMPADELITRAKCQFAKVDISDALRDQMTPLEAERMAMVSGHEFLQKLTIHDSGDMTIDDFRARAEHKVRNEGVGLIVLDYAQLMEADRKRYPNEALQNEAISKGIRATARSLNVPILLIVHLNRQGEAHGSTQYEKDAHVRLKLSREVGSPVMDVDIVKNRNGATGSIRTPCDMRYGLVGKRDNIPPYNPRAGMPDNRTEPNRDEPF